MSRDRSSAFEVGTHTGPADELHAREFPVPPTRQVWILGVTRPALVLGSSQDPAIVDAAACAQRGVDVVKRRSGGGLVLLEPDAQAWVDVVIPTGDPHWVEDVSKAFGWLGEAWQAALRSLGVETRIVTGRLEVGSWGQLVCFAGSGQGELLLGGSKVVGMSLRRTREGARFQTTALAAWRPERLLPLLAPGVVYPEELLAGIAASGAGLDIAPSVLANALVAELALRR